MAFNTQFIFPTSVYGQISDVYGTNVTQYANTGGFPQNSGLVLGQFGVLFDGTICRLLKANGNIAQFAAVTPMVNSANYTVQTTTTANTVPIVATNDRGGSTTLTTGSIAWMTNYGFGTTLIAASTTAGQAVVSSTTAGQLQAFTVGTSIFGNIILLQTSTTAGSYAVLFQ